MTPSIRSVEVDNMHDEVMDDYINENASNPVASP